MYSQPNNVLDGTSIQSENIILSDDDSILSSNPEIEIDSDLSFSDELNAKPKTELLPELKQWQMVHNINKNAFDELLKMLSRHGHLSLSRLSNSINPLKREASSPIMMGNRQNLHIPSTSNNNTQNRHDISERLDTVEQKIDLHQIATQQVLANQATMQQMLNLILEKFPGEPQIPMDDLDTKLLPITTVNMLEEYELKLRNIPEFKNKMIRVLSQFGGPDAKKTTRNIARAMLSDEVLVNFSWTGTNTKRIFSSFREINSTIIATMRKRFPNYTEYDNATFFKEYLKHANTRLCRNELKIFNM